MNPDRINYLSETTYEIIKEQLFIDDDFEVFDKKFQKLLADNNTVLELSQLKIKDESVFIQFFYEIKDYFQIFNLVNDKFQELLSHKEDNYKNYKFYIFFDTLEDQIQFEKKYESDASFSKRIKEKSKIHGKIQFRTLFFPNNNKKSYSIRIDSFLKRIDKTVKNNSSFMCTAKLSDIISIYNNLGDRLYNKNVRVKIKDAIGVDRAICKTLEREPENFWFFNNGITMILNENCLSNDVENILKISPSSDNDISIVNGAQTITVSSLFYYGMSEEDRKRIDDADILLRIVFETETNRSFCNDITLSLNRQKPIRQSDIRYFTPVIECINTLEVNQDNKKFQFKVLKNGETLPGDSNYELEKFGKIFSCYNLQEPGTARSAKGVIFEDDEYWKKFDIDQTNIESSFIAKYKPLNDAIWLYDYVHKYLRNSTDIDDESPRNKLKLYCTDFFVAYFIWFYNNKSNKDFSDYVSTINKKKNEEIDKKITVFIDSIYSFFEDPYEEIDSNYFKSNSNYFKIREYLDKKNIWK